ncbi:MAG: ligase-associated DNA damage response exonuclease [Sphingobacteriia bacterium]|nr:MAG: ligase-associated DNA damage response exonuclease [Sphingobacteriia bacterium]
MPLLQLSPQGLYCAVGDFFIDPWGPVNKALITHAHSDHARGGSQHYMCQDLTKPILQLRLGKIAVDSLPYGKPVWHNGVKISFHPAGHVLGSAQIRLEYQGETWVVSGDYKTAADGLSTPFEPVACQHFITESTFGLPIYQWAPQAEVFSQMRNWALAQQSKDRIPVFEAYGLGKAQRILPAFAQAQIPIYLHPRIWHTHQAFLEAGVDLPTVLPLTAAHAKAFLPEAVVIAPPGSSLQAYLPKNKTVSTAMCSGWMTVNAQRKQQDKDAGFALSDHADWPGLLSAVKATGAENIYVTHGFQTIFTRYLNEQGWRAQELKTAFQGDAATEEESA